LDGTKGMTGVAETSATSDVYAVGDGFLTGLAYLFVLNASMSELCPVFVHWA